MTMMIKQILRLLFLLAMYELGKYVTEQVYIMMTANDDVEAPSDFAKLSDQSDLMRAEVSEQMMWLVIAIILLVILLFGVMLQAEQLKGDVKVKEREIEILRSRLRHFED